MLFQKVQFICDVMFYLQIMF